VVRLVPLHKIVLGRNFFLNEGEAHWVSAWLGIFMINAWNKISLELYLLVELVLAVAEAGSFFKTVPFLSALTVSVGPPLGMRSSLGSIGALDLSGSSESIWMRRWLAITIAVAWNKVALKLDLTVELFLAIREACSLLETVPLLRSLTIAICPPFSIFLVKTIYLSVGSEAHWVLRWLLVATVEVWNTVAIFHLLVELLLAVGEAGGLFGSVPFLRALAIAVCPP